MPWAVTYGANQSDSSSAEEEIIAEGLQSLAAARACVRAELGVARLRRERSWHQPADGVYEGWVVDLGGESGDGYFIHFTH
jgi:hypothetical protein